MQFNFSFRWVEKPILHLFACSSACFGRHPFHHGFVCSFPCSSRTPRRRKVKICEVDKRILMRMLKLLVRDRDKVARCRISDIGCRIDGWLLCQEKHAGDFWYLMLDVVVGMERRWLWFVVLKTQTRFKPMNRPSQWRRQLIPWWVDREVCIDPREIRLL